MNIMYVLSIFDRDQQEMLGIKWLISKYAFPISEIQTDTQLAAVIEILENNAPHILCLELDMIPEDKWELIYAYLSVYRGKVIAMTAEATFERATQAMSMKAIDLWVKPISPTRIKQGLQQAIHQLGEINRNEPFEKNIQEINYHSLFRDDYTSFLYPVYLLKPEYKADLDLLQVFIEQFDFYDQPLLFSRSDGIVLVFRKDFPKAYEQAQRLLSEWEQTNGKPLSIVVHEGSNDKSLHQIYLQALQTMELTFFRGYRQVLLTNIMKNWVDMDPFLTMEEQRNWIHMLEAADREGIKTWMYQDFFTITMPYPEPGLLRTRLTSILAQVRRFMKQKGITQCEDAYQSIFHRVLYEPVLYRIVQDFILFINDLFQVIEENTVKFDVIETAIRYMEDNYAEPELSLIEVAEYVGRSPSYFSDLLSKRLQQSFRQLLLQIRMDKAKEILNTTDYPIRQVAEEVGFKQANYFSRVFKKTTNMTPREWRQGNKMKG